MNGYNDYMMKQEQYRDQLRGAERYRVVKLVADDCQESTFGETLRNLFSGMTKRQQSAVRVPCGEYGRLAESAA